MVELIYPVDGAPQLPASAKYHPEPGKTIEWLPVVNENGEVVAQAPRAFIHREGGVLHPVVHLQIINRLGEIYLQKRAKTKDLLPGYWDTAVGGHISYGETSWEALFREAGEELGLSEFNPVFLMTYINESPRERELVFVYAIVGNFTPVPDGDEVEEGAYWPESRIESCLGTGVLTPNFEDEYSRIKDSLNALL